MSDSEQSLKKLWLRVGMTLSLTDDEVRQVFESDDMDKAVLSAIRSGRAVPDGNTYVPYECVEGFNRSYGTDYEVGEYETEL
jgi:hypothetical protein